MQSIRGRIQNGVVLLLEPAQDYEGKDAVVPQALPRLAATIGAVGPGGNEQRHMIVGAGIGNTKLNRHAI